ncbi:hypothetical protein L9F63_015871, partial [Diploptera punctata]
TKFLCSEVIAPIKSEVDDICLYIINFEDLTAPPEPLEEDVTPTQKLTKFGRARQSIRKSFKMGSLRGQSLRLTGYLTPPSDVTTEEAEEEEDEKKVEQSLKSGNQREATTPTQFPSVLYNCTCVILFVEEMSPAVAREIQRRSRKGAQTSPEVLSQRSGNMWEVEESRPNVPHATSLDAITRRPRVPEPSPHKGPSRSATVSVSTRNHVAKTFPNTSSESDLQRYRAVWDRPSREKKSPSLSNVASDSLRHKFSIQDNGSAKFFQGALHTPNMGEKVAQA